MSISAITASSGMISQHINLTAISNDLANLNTNNYKASEVHFADVIYASVNGPQNLKKNSIATQGFGVSVSEITRDFTPGQPRQTHHWNDVAINGVGFFQLINETGDVVYSRGSTLSIDKEGYLCGVGGLRLKDNIQIPADSLSVAIKSNGEVEVILPNEANPIALGNIELARFNFPEGLTPIGNGQYMQSERSGDAIAEEPKMNGMGELQQYHIEASNVDMVSSLMRLSQAQRIYQLSAKALQMADEIEKTTTELLA